MEPLNYQFADPNAAILNGIKMSAGLTAMQQQAQDRQTALAQQQQANVLAQQQQMDLQRLAMNPNAGHADYASLMTKYPALSEHLGKAFKVLDEGQQGSLLNFNTRLYAASNAGNDDLAVQMLEERAKADPAGAQHYKTMADLVRQSPGTARTTLALSLAGAMGPDKFATAFPALGTDARAEQQQPAEVARKVAEAREAQLKAGNAPTAIVLKNEKDRQDILSAEAQRRVADFNSQIGAANSETERGRLTLERDKFVADQTLKAGTAGNEAQDQFDVITQGLDTVKSLRADLNDKWKWTGVGSFTGKLRGLIPGTDAKDFRAKLDTLKGQQFLAQSQKMRGLGALTEIEGAKIEKAVATLDPDMTPEAFSNALGVIEVNLAKGHAKLLAMGKLPTNGGAFVMRHPTLGNVGDADINRLLKQYPGSTREQVLEYLRQTGGK